MPIDRKLLQSLTVVVVVLVIAYLAWHFVSTELASGLVGLLAGRLIDQFLVFGRKDANSRLEYRSRLLTQPLQTIFYNLASPSVGWLNGIDPAIAVFVNEIQDKALIKVLQKDSELLPSLLTKLVELEHEMSMKEPEAELELERFKDEGILPSRVNIAKYVKVYVRNKEPHLAELVERIRNEIEVVLAKYSGA